MALHDEVVQPDIATVEVDGVPYVVSVRIVFDGIEYVGRLWFAEEGWEDPGIPDRTPLPGASREEVTLAARRIPAATLVLRCRRALAEKRRYGALRRATDEILAKIRFLNQLSLTMRAGLLDLEGAAQEIDLTERQLHVLIDRLREHAGTEE